MPNGAFVAYFRVSTQRQGREGHSVQAQREAVTAHIARLNGNGQLVAEFEERESGRKADRPHLAAALAACRVHGATLVIARLDRLARNARFLLGLIESGVDVVFCDLPTIPPGPTGKFILTQMAAVAELEAGLISERTRAALAAAKAKGKRLGNPGNFTAAGRLRGSRLGNAVKTAKALARARDVMPAIEAARLELAPDAPDDVPYHQIAAKLNERGIRSPRGADWHATSIKRVLDRAE